VKFLPTEIPAVVLVEVDVFRDARGFFGEVYHAAKYEAAGLPGRFVQDNQSHSRRGVLRGLHAQVGTPQGKLVRALQGEIFDVAVDVRRGSPTYGRWVGEVLSAENFRQLYVPPGFLHGFCVLSDSADVEYKCSGFYAPQHEIGVRWNDPDIAIAWPLDAPLLSEKDNAAPLLRDIVERLPTLADDGQRGG
jgi:dTDP-4-dehydrorhamnose 3,5-epimerase